MRGEPTKHHLGNFAFKKDQSVPDSEDVRSFPDGETEASKSLDT